MRRCVAASTIWLVTLAVAAACSPAAIEPTFTPMLLPSATAGIEATLSPTIAPTATATPEPTTTPTPGPTLDPAAISTMVSSGRMDVTARGVNPLCLRWEDTDGDGVGEWLGLYLQEAAVPELHGFVLDGETWYELAGMENGTYGLGSYATCELEVRDVNADGAVEIVIGGRAAGTVGLLHIFSWDGDGYQLVAPFEGPAGVRMENRDGDLADEIVLRYIHRAGRAWEAIYTWDGQSYGWTWERYAWYYLDRPHAYSTGNPEDAVISYYLALGDRDMPAAYSLLSAGTRAASPFETWVGGFASLLAVEVGAVGELSSDESSAAVACQVRSFESTDGRVFIVLYDVQWILVLGPDGWRLQSVTATELERLEAVYYP